MPPLPPSRRLCPPSLSRRCTLLKVSVDSDGLSPQASARVLTSARGRRVCRTWLSRNPRQPIDSLGVFHGTVAPASSRLFKDAGKDAGATGGACFSGRFSVAGRLQRSIRVSLGEIPPNPPLQRGEARDETVFAYPPFTRTEPCLSVLAC